MREQPLKATFLEFFHIACQKEEMLFEDSAVDINFMVTCSGYSFGG